MGDSILKAYPNLKIINRRMGHFLLLETIRGRGGEKVIKEGSGVCGL